MPHIDSPNLKSFNMEQKTKIVEAGDMLRKYLQTRLTEMAPYYVNKSRHTANIHEMVMDVRLVVGLYKKIVKNVEAESSIEFKKGLGLGYEEYLEGIRKASISATRLRCDLLHLAISVSDIESLLLTSS